MLLQTNSYVVPREKRSEHARLIRRFKQTLHRLGCDQFDVYEQVGANWSNGESTGRFVQIMRFRDRKHQLSVQAAERNDPTAQALIAEFCELINFPYQQQQGLFAVGFYSSIVPVNRRPPVAPEQPQQEPEAAAESEAAAETQAEPQSEAEVGAEEPEAESEAEVDAQLEPPTDEPFAEDTGDQDIDEQSEQPIDQELETEFVPESESVAEPEPGVDSAVEEMDEPPPSPEPRRRT